MDDYVRCTKEAALTTVLLLRFVQPHYLSGKSPIDILISYPM